MRTREEEGVGTLIDTFVVSSCNTGLICDPLNHTCAVKCKLCPVRAACAHTLVCSCPTFNNKYACEHLHLVLHHQSQQKEVNSQDHDYSTGTSELIQDIDYKIPKDDDIIRVNKVPEKEHFATDTAENAPEADELISEEAVSYTHLTLPTNREV